MVRVKVGENECYSIHHQTIEQIQNLTNTTVKPRWQKLNFVLGSQ